jgi:hypothetical protein
MQACEKGVSTMNGATTFSLWRWEGLQMNIHKKRRQTGDHLAIFVEKSFNWEKETAQ